MSTEPAKTKTKTKRDSESKSKDNKVDTSNKQKTRSWRRELVDMKTIAGSMKVPMWTSDHLRKVGKIKKFACTKCPRRFSSVMPLQRHFKTHTT